MRIRRLRTDSDPMDDLLSRFLLFAEGDGEGEGGGSGGEGEGDGDQGDSDGEGDGAGKGDEGEGGEGSGGDDWRAPITDPDAQKFAKSSTDLNHLVGRALEMRKQLSTAIQIPGKDASDDDVAAYRKATGVPAEATGYKFDVPEGREPAEADKAFQSAAAETFHGLNVSAEQEVTGTSIINILISNRFFCMIDSGCKYVYPEYMRRYQYVESIRFNYQCGMRRLFGPGGRTRGTTATANPSSRTQRSFVAE